MSKVVICGVDTSTLPKIKEEESVNLLKKIADENGEKFPAMVSANSSAYEMLVNIDENGFVTHYDWDGYVLMEKNVGYDNSAYIKADSVALRISMQEPYGAQPGVMTHEVSLRVENKLNKVKSDVALPTSSVQLKHQWMFDVKYDEYGNWTYLKVGPYEVNRTIIYL